MVHCPFGGIAEEDENDDNGLDDEDDKGYGEGKTYRGWPLTLCAPPRSLLPLTCTAPVQCTYILHQWSYVLCQWIFAKN